MGILGDIFGFSASNLSTEEKSVSRAVIDNLVSSSRVQSLSQKEAIEIRQELDKRRRGDGKISLAQVHEVLLRLRNQNKISEVDKKGVERQFKNYFENS